MIFRSHIFRNGEVQVAPKSVEDADVAEQQAALWTESIVSAVADIPGLSTADRAAAKETFEDDLQAFRAALASVKEVYLGRGQVLDDRSMSEAKKRPNSPRL